MFILFEHNPFRSATLSEDWDEDKMSRPEVEHMLKSFRWIRCCFNYFSNPASNYLLSLSGSFAIRVPS